MGSLKNSPLKNTIPEKVETIHMIAVCGTGMGALASMLKDLGYAVTGSDLKVYPPMSDFLRQRGIPIAEGFDPRNLDYRPDLVVVGNAVSRDNVEVERMQELGLHCCSMPQAINRFVAAGKKQILITGTHGKTTTASIVAWILDCAGLDETFFIGGILANFNSNYRLGKGAHIVIEGDEYDTAFFDKGPKFMHYDPVATVLTSVEFDHADIFRDEAHVLDIFSAFASGLDSAGTLFACDGDDNVAQVVSKASCRVVPYGSHDGSLWRIDAVAASPPWSAFEVLKGGSFYGRFRTLLPGRHNMSNALAAIAVADLLGISREVVAGALEGFKGVKRRQEVRGIKNGIVVLDDFAHHPTAVRETLLAVRERYRGRRLVAVFEPRSNSSRRNVFQEAYALCFDPADRILIREPALTEKIPPEQRFSASKLAGDLRTRGLDADAFPDTDRLLEACLEGAREGDVLCVMSNGAFDNLIERLLAGL